MLPPPTVAVRVIFSTPRRECPRRSDRVTGLAVVPTAAGVRVRYTWVGDANADGALDADDYARIHRGFLGRSANFYQGDFYFDERIDLDDYPLIDRG